MDTTTSPRLKEIGQWSEQFSSSGKRYYYNRETEVSQWEKPAEWKQAERDQAEHRVRSSTTTTREDKNASYSKPRHRPSVSSTSVAAHSTSVSAKPADSSSGHAVRSSTSSPSVLNSSTAPKRPRLDEQPPSFSSQSATRHIPSSSSTTLSASKKVLQPSVAGPTVSSSTDHQQQRCASVSSSSPAGQSHQTPPISSFSSPSVSKRMSFSSTVVRTEDENCFSRQSNNLRLPSKSVSTPTVTEEPKKGGGLLVDNNTKCQTNEHQKLLPVKSGLSASEIFANPNHRIGNSKLGNEFDQSEKQPQAPRDDVYTKFYHPEPGSLAMRRLLNCEEFFVGLKRCSDRKAKHANILLSIGRDLNSVQTLSKVAEFRSQLLKQRIAATSKRIQELESKSQ